MNFRSSLGDPPRKADGGVGDADYASIGVAYARYGELRSQEYLEGALVLVVSTPER